MKPSRPTAENIDKAAAIIHEGGVVVMPTETVYGLAADATSVQAIKRIFKAKGRPSDNPLIIHISDFVQLDDVVSEWNDYADVLSNRFWPGPLTLILKKSDLIPDEATGGLDTVAVRMPAHEVALELIEACGVPLAAPSANRFMHLSPTRAEDIEPEIAKSVGMILDGGPCQVGLESTVVDVTVDPPMILRPGGISRGDIQAALGLPLGQIPLDGLRRAPGMYRRHYAPDAPIALVEKIGKSAIGLTFGSEQNPGQVQMPRDPGAYGALLYAALHRVDALKPNRIEVEVPPTEPEWEAIIDRLKKAIGKP